MRDMVAEVCLRVEETLRWSKGRMATLAVKKEKCYMHVVFGVQGLSLCGWKAKGQFEEAEGWLPGKVWEDEVQSGWNPGGAGLECCARDCFLYWEYTADSHREGDGVKYVS